MSLKDWETVKVTYAVPVTEKQFLQIVEEDLERDVNQLYKLLEIVVDDIVEADYSGYFGPNIFVTFEKPPNKKQVDQVEKTIKGYIGLL